MTGRVVNCRFWCRSTLYAQALEKAVVGLFFVLRAAAGMPLPEAFRYDDLIFNRRRSRDAENFVIIALVRLPWYSGRRSLI
jgi:hypothetical protein